MDKFSLPSTSNGVSRNSGVPVSNDTLENLMNNTLSSMSTENESELSDNDLATYPLRASTPLPDIDSPDSRPSTPSLPSVSSPAPVIVQNTRRARAHRPVIDWDSDSTSMKQYPYQSYSHLKVAMQPDAKPIDFFKLFVTDQFIDMLVTETNVQAQFLLQNSVLGPNAALSKWQDVEKEEMCIFLGLLLHMGMIHCQRMRDYWKTHRLYRIPCFREYMSRNRFFSIVKCFHFARNPSANEPAPTDRLYKIRPIVDHFNKTIQDIYEPGKELCIDESMILWRGRLIFRQYIKNKKHKYGVKLYMLTEPCGLVLKFAIYAGANDDDLGGVGHVNNVVMHLMQDRLDLGHSLYMDNYYNSFSLSLSLLERKTHCTGTLRAGRKDTPALVIETKLSRGEVVCLYGEGVAIGKWRDKRDVRFITTEHVLDMEECTNKRGDKKLKPTAIVQYNKHMGGIDRQDQMLAYYPVSRKTTRWYKKIGIHIIEMMLVNAHMIYSKSVGRRMSLYDFREHIIEELLPENYTPPSRRRRMDNELTQNSHFANKCPIGRNGKKLRKRCKQCYDEGKRRDTMYYCPKCPGQPGLCLETCFVKFHGH